MKTLYFLTQGKHYHEEIDRLHFDIVLVNHGHLPSRTGFWMRWGEDNERDFYEMDRKFGFESQGIKLCQGMMFPEDWLWSEEYEHIIIVGDAGMLRDCMKSIHVFDPEKFDPEEKYDGAAEHFIYKAECEVRNHKFLVDKGYFIYECEA